MASDRFASVSVQGATRSQVSPDGNTGPPSVIISQGNYWRRHLLTDRTGSSLLSLSTTSITLAEVFAGSLFLLLTGMALPRIMVSAVAWLPAVSVYALISILVLGYWRHGPLAWANRVTLIRAVLISIVAAGTAVPLSSPGHWQWLGVALLALTLDGVDGWIARRTDSRTSFGARFDMELDSLLILILSLGLMLKTPLGPWVLLIGLMRYAFVIAGWRFIWLQGDLFYSWRRKSVCVWQIAALLAALLPWVSQSAGRAITLSALLLLVYSFAVDIIWLYRRKPQVQSETSRLSG
ncbi:MAG: CDP-alcohol phosphatidyltransferase family protein [Spirochaetales bacterium]